MTTRIPHPTNPKFIDALARAPVGSVAQARLHNRIAYCAGLSESVKLDILARADALAEAIRAAVPPARRQFRAFTRQRSNQS